MLDGNRIPNGQLEWLLRGLAASDARWKFLVSSSVWNPRSKQEDSWAQFQHERRKLIDWIGRAGIGGVIVLSADIHSGGAIDNGVNSHFPELRVPATNVGRPPSGCTGGHGCGKWSEGVHSGGAPAGYALVTVEHDPAGGDSVLLQARDAAGAVRLEYRVR